MREYIGDLQEYFEVEYAKSNRSSCRKCKQKIDKNQIRLGIHFDDEKFSTDNWFHLGCFQFKPRHRVLNIENIGNHIVGTDQLTPKDYNIVIKRLKADFKELEKRKLSLNKNKTYEKHGKYDWSQDEKLSKNQETEQRKQEGKKFIKKSRRKPVPHEVISKKKNSQTKMGHKEELAARCADGKQFGRIPPCPKCGGGHLRFDRDKGFYYCPGYMEDTDFVHCNGKFNFDDVQREPWKE